MPIGTTAAIIGSAAIGAGASLSAAKKNSKAINQASDAQAEANRESIALQREIYNENKGALAPWQARGLAADTQIDDVLKLFPGGNPADATGAFDAFRNSTGYNFRFDEGVRANNAGYAGRGVLQSGAAQKSLLNYGQGMASGEYGNWLQGLQVRLGALTDRTNRGFSAASAQAGVGQNFANSITSLNAANAGFMGQAAIARANNSAGTMGALGNIAGQTVGALSSYGSFGPSLSPVNYGALTDAANNVRIAGF